MTGTVTPRGVGGQFAWVSSGRILAALLQAVLLVLAARAMPKETFGLLMALIGVIVLLQVVCDAGVGTFTARERAAHPESGGVASALKFLTLSSAILVAAISSVLAVSAALVSSTLWLMLPLALWAAGERNADMRLSVALADGDAHVNVSVLVARRAGSILGFTALLALDVNPVLAYSLASAATAVASATFAYFYIRPRVTAVPSLTVRGLLRRSRPYWVAAIALQARNLDALLVSTVSGSAAAGIYASGSRLVNPLQILPTSLAAVLLPTAARGERSAAQLRSLVRLALLLVAALCVIYAGLFLGAGVFVARALGAEYAGTTTVIRIILLGLPFSAAGALFIAILQGQGRPGVVALASSVSTGFSLVAIPFAAAAGGAPFAAGVLAISFVLQFSVLTVALLGLRRDLRNPSVVPGQSTQHGEGGDSEPSGILAIAFTPSPPDQSPNLRRASLGEGLDTYYRSMVVAFASYARWLPGARLVLITDEPVPSAYAEHFDALGVEVLGVQFTHRPPPGFTHRFAASLYSLDALDALRALGGEARLPVALLDPDCLAVGPLTPLLDRASRRICAYPLDLPPERASNGLSAVDAALLHQELDPTLTGLPVSYGGECYAFTAEAIAPVISEAQRVYRHTLHRPEGTARITTEEHALNYALRRVEVDQVDDLVRRIWTAPTRRTVQGDEAGLILWHLPAEKDRGIAEVLNDALDRSSWFWTASRDAFVAKLGRTVGVSGRGPSRWAYDALGRVVRRTQGHRRS